MSLLERGDGCVFDLDGLAIRAAATGATTYDANLLPATFDQRLCDQWNRAGEGLGFPQQISAGCTAKEPLDDLIDHGDLLELQTDREAGRKGCVWRTWRWPGKNNDWLDR